MLKRRNSFIVFTLWQPFKLLFPQIYTETEFFFSGADFELIVKVISN